MRTIILIILRFTILFGMMSVCHANMSEARNFYQFNDQILTAGQPDQALLEKAAEDGIEVVINLVPTSESIYNAQEVEILEKQGIKYIHTPVNWYSPKDSEFESFLQAMEEAGDKKVLVHCWANARASALVFAHLALKSPEIKEKEFSQLHKTWTDVAGYNLKTNQAWRNFLNKHVGTPQ